MCAYAGRWNYEVGITLRRDIFDIYLYIHVLFSLFIELKVEDLMPVVSIKVSLLPFKAKEFIILKKFVNACDVSYGTSKL